MKEITGLFKEKIWDWPGGLAWKISEKFILASIRKKYEIFISLIKPQPNDKILDIGVAPYMCLGANFLEQWYQWPEKIVALAYASPKEYKGFYEHSYKFKLIFGDGKALPFPDNYFDVVCCNAVVEHAGNFEEQKKLIYEIMRAGKRVFITTPNYWFPLDTHTLIPFAHYLPLKIRFRVYKILHRGYFADLNILNLLKLKEFLCLFPKRAKVKIIKQRFLGMVSGFIAIGELR